MTALRYAMGAVVETLGALVTGTPPEQIEGRPLPTWAAALVALAPLALAREGVVR